MVPEWGGAESGTLEESGSSPRGGVGAHFVLWAILASPLLSAPGAPWRGVNLGPQLPSSRHKDRGPQFPQRQKLGSLQQIDIRGAHRSQAEGPEVCPCWTGLEVREAS